MDDKTGKFYAEIHDNHNGIPISVYRYGLYSLNINLLRVGILFNIGIVAFRFKWSSRDFVVFWE